VPGTLQIGLLRIVAMLFLCLPRARLAKIRMIRGRSMPRLAAPFLLLLLLASPAHAVIKGTPSARASYTVRLLGKGYLLQRRGHRARRHRHRGPLRSHIPSIGGRSLRVAGISHAAVLDDGRRASVSGDAVVLRLASPLPAEVAPAPVGEGSGDSYTIVGYGTTDERWRSSSGVHEATLVAERAGALVDPNRTGSIGASACFGDSGGPVLRGGMLVGVISRASHPSAYLVCGHLTHWVAVTASASTAAADSSITDKGVAVEQPQDQRPQKSQPPGRMRAGAATSFNPFAMVAPVR